MNQTTFPLFWKRAQRFSVLDLFIRMLVELRQVDEKGIKSCSCVQLSVIWRGEKFHDKLPIRVAR